MLNDLAAVDGSIPADRAVEHLVRLAKNGMPIEVLLLNVQRKIATSQTHGWCRRPWLPAAMKRGKRAAEIAERVLQAAVELLPNMQNARKILEVCGEID